MTSLGRHAGDGRPRRRYAGTESTPDPQVLIKRIRGTCHRTETSSPSSELKTRKILNLRISFTRKYNLVAQKKPTMTTLDLSNFEHVEQYLSATPWAAKSVVQLSGGYTNFTFRIELAEPFEGQERVVLKHAKSYVAGAKEWSLPIERQVKFLCC